MTESQDSQQANEMVENLKRRLNDNPTDLEAALTLGNMFYDANDPAQAVLYYRIALDIDPKNAGARTDMGTMYWHNENLSMAEQAYRTVIRENPGFGNAYLNLGYLLLHGKQAVKEARAIWTELITGWPKDPAAHKIRELLMETMN